MWEIPERQPGRTGIILRGSRIRQALTGSVSSNFIIGMDGEIIQCVPIDEMAYASNTRNSDTVSIECCHPGKDGQVYGGDLRLPGAPDGVAVPGAGFKAQRCDPPL